MSKFNFSRAPRCLLLTFGIGIGDGVQPRERIYSLALGSDKRPRLGRRKKTLSGMTWKIIRVNARHPGK
jgi:hypothetical protein